MTKQREYDPGLTALDQKELPREILEFDYECFPGLKLRYHGGMLTVTINSVASTFWIGAENMEDAENFFKKLEAL